MRSILTLAAVLVCTAVASAQNCPNGQCPTVRYVYPQQSFAAPQSGATASTGNVVTWDITGMGPTRIQVGPTGNVILGPAEAATDQTCPGGACPAPAYSTGAADALDEVNQARARRGLPPFVRDEALTRGAMGCAQARASRLSFGHTANDFAFLPPGTACSATGCAAYPPSYGWLSCATYDGYRSAGAAWVMGVDGKRYMSLFVR